MTGMGRVQARTMVVGVLVLDQGPVAKSWSVVSWARVESTLGTVVSRDRHFWTWIESTSGPSFLGPGQALRL